MSRIKYILSLLAIASVAIVSSAQNSSIISPYPDYREEVFMDMDLEPNILSPSVPQNLHDVVSGYIEDVASGIMDKYTVDLMRDGEVMVISVPSDELFLPNDTLLCKYAGPEMAAILPLIKDPYMYKVLISVHTDDTGSESHRERLSNARLNSIYEWFLDKIDEGVLSEDLVIIPYSMGSSEPIEENDTRDHRKANRRLEVYLVPGPKLIELARTGKLN